MATVIGVRFEQDGRVFDYDALDFAPAVGDYVIVNTAKGLDLGEVIVGARNEENTPEQEHPKMVRLATEQDIAHATENRQREQEAFVICQRKIAEHKLEMKLVSVECSFDNSKMLFYFTANGRVDFRSLVKDLASVFKTRIELRQIGVRDEARMIGGLGACGRPICCRSFLSDFQPVSIKMAKEQNLSLNPTKISGVCGRLMCCLKYEQDQYETVRKQMPRIGKEVVTPDGNGIVADLNILKETVSVRISRNGDFEVVEYPMDQVARPGTAPASLRKPEEQEQENAKDELEFYDVPDEWKNDEDLTQMIEAESEPAPVPEKKTERKHNRPPRGQRKKDGNREVNKDKEESGEEKSAASTRERKLGQPVRRENPARNRGGDAAGSEGKKRSKAGQEKANRPMSAPAAEANANPQAPKTDPPPTQAQPASSKPRASGWADALEKAMQAADRQ